MKTIIVPTDFSPIATNAMNFAADMAVNINASLMLLHVYQVPVSMPDVPVVLMDGEVVFNFGLINRLPQERLENQLSERKF